MRPMLFLHIIGFTFWLGSMVAVYVMYRKNRALAGEGHFGLVSGTIRTVVWGILNPSAVLVLFTGIGMISAMGLVGNPKPFWLMFMEMFGGMAALLSIALLSWQARRLAKADSAEEGSRRLAGFMRVMMPVGISVAATIFVVALRLG